MLYKLCYVVVILYHLENNDQKKSQCRGNSCRPNYMVHFSNNINFFSLNIFDLVLFPGGVSTGRIRPSWVLVATSLSLSSWTAEPQQEKKPFSVTSYNLGSSRGLSCVRTTS